MRFPVWRRKQERELEEEIRSHLEMATRERVDRGESPKNAEHSTRREFGNVALVQDVTRDQWGWTWLEALLQDLRYAARMLHKNPGFTTVVLLTLALGIGVNSALFSIVNGVLLNPLPYANPAQLTALYQTTTNLGHSSIAYPNFLDWQKDNRSFSAIAAYRNDDYNLTGQGAAERVKTGMVSSEFFPVLGVPLAMGRNFTPEEDKTGAGPVAIISSGFWSRKFGSSRDVLGKVLVLNEEPYTIVGVLPPHFRFRSDNEIYVPIGPWKHPAFHDRAISIGMKAVGRLKPGVTIQQASSNLDAIAHNLAATFPDTNTGSGIAAVPLKQDMVGDIAQFLLVLLAAVGFVLLIACANVANLTLARSMARAREFAIRVALGAGRYRILAQLLTESVLLGVAGGGLGLLLAAYGTKSVLKILPDALPRSSEIGLDSHVLAFTFVLSIFAGIVFGLAPALRVLRPDANETLKEGGRGSSGTRHGVQGVFVIAEVGVALVLLVGAGLMIRTLSALWSIDPGFNAHNLLTFRMSFPASLAASPSGIRSALREFHERLRALPGVQRASIIDGSLPLQDDAEIPFWLDGHPKPAAQNDMPLALYYVVEPEYLEAMQTPLLRGRFLTQQDDERSPLVVVIDEMFARGYFAGEDPIGKRINIQFIGSAEIVGLAGHVKHWGLDTDAKETIQAQLYMPMTQLPERFMPEIVRRGQTYVARSANAPAALTAPIRDMVQQMSANQVAYAFETMDDVVADSLAARRFSMFLLGIFAALALVLASIGVYGVISYLVSRRTHEIGIRLALGARRGDVLRLVLGAGFKMAGVGLLIGLAGAFALTRLMSKMLYGVKATDPLTFVAVAALLTLVALAACYIPARRAMRVDPMVALRYE
jgi:predicted permease